MDQLAWDLGNPDDTVAINPMPIRLGSVASNLIPNINGTGVTAQFSALKGPMTTQTLRGMVNSGPMHWRGDRSNGFFQPASATDEVKSFKNFIVAFPGLVGRTSLLAETDMVAFTDFQLKVILPPNPVRKIDNSLTPAQANGRNFFLGQSFTSVAPNGSTTGVGGSSITGRRADGANATDNGFTCAGCHGLDASQGFFGADQQASFENESQIMKVAHLRNLYQKVGMFGMPDVAFNNVLNTPHQGNQVRGFGFLHDGSTDTVFRFFQATVFNQANPFNLGTVGFTTNANGGNGVRRDVEQFALAFDSDLAPVVGQQVTLSSTNSAVVNPRIATFIARAGTPFVSQVLGAGQNECDLVVKGTIGGVAKGWQYLPGTGFRPSDGGPDIADATLRANATVPGQELTYTCATPGSGQRAGIDRDRDAVIDGADNCSDVANAGQADGDTDLRGDNCDNCALKTNANQSDVDADGAGDVCDNQCIASSLTTLTGLVPTVVAQGQYVELVGTGFGPAVSTLIGSTPVTPFLLAGIWRAQVPIGLAAGTYNVRVVNPEGCESQEANSLQVTAAPAGCGLTGIEPFLLLGLMGVRRLARLIA
jgi:hypothetical protein